MPMRVIGIDRGREIHVRRGGSATRIDELCTSLPDSRENECHGEYRT
jgi:hypothetical protein